MPPKKKQTSRNGFFYFMQDLKRRQGNKFNSMQAVADAAAPLWERMPRDQRKIYDDQAVAARNNIRGTKMTSEGLDVEQLEMEERREQQKIQAMKEEITFNLKMAAKGGRLHKETIFLIHINIFCHCTSQDRYYPAELAIVGFTLNEGIMDKCVFHRILHPGRLPLGYACEANLHCKETHQLPIPLSDEPEFNLKDVYQEMKDFLIQNSEGSKQLPVLYGDDKLLKMIQNVLDAMAYDSGDEERQFRIYNLQYMFRVLRNTVAGDQIWPSDTYSTREIEKDVNAHATGISCEFHEGTNAMVNCSLSIVTRFAFTICDNCCPDLQIPLKPGKHVPQNSRLPSLRSSSMQSLESHSSQYSTNLKPTTREDDSESVVSVSSKSAWDASSVYSEDSSSFGPPKDTSEDFPPLGEDSSRNSYKTFSERSSTSTTRSVRSYAGITGPSGLCRESANPSSLADEFENIGLTTPQETPWKVDFPVLGKGRARRTKK